MTAQASYDGMTNDDMMNGMFNDTTLEYEPNLEDSMLEKVKGFLELLRASEEPLHKHIIVPTLAFLTRLIAIKSKFTFSSKCYNRIIDYTMMSLQHASASALCSYASR